MKKGGQLRKNKIEKVDRRAIVIFFLLIVVVIPCLMLRCRYSLSTASGDEFSQPATINRYLHGDIPLLDNWTASTMFSGFVMSLVCRLFGIGMVPVLTARYMYVVYQAIIAVLIVLLIPKKDMSHMTGCLAYLCSTPYNINRITYNTLSIGMFVLFCVLFFDVKERQNSLRIIVSGMVLAFSVLAIPHNALVYFVYASLVVLSYVLRIAHRNDNTIWGWNRLGLLTFGIILVAIPFAIYLFFNGSLDEYSSNLKYIFSDAEYSKSIVVKLIESHYRIIRIYWRVWMPLGLLDLVTIALGRKNKKAYRIVYILSNIVVIYGILRFVFVYGSVSINLAVPPIFFLRVQMVVLCIIFDRKFSDIDVNYVNMAWLIAGYIFYICEYLATDTEILASSATLIVAAIPSLALSYRAYAMLEDDVSNNAGTMQDEKCGSAKVSSKTLRIVPLATAATFVVSLFILRMTFVWGDAPLPKLDTKITEGTAKGIITTQESADTYRRAEKIIEKADIAIDDQVLVLPMNPTYYYLIDAGCSSPYVFRFEVSVEELNNYYALHSDKIPTVVVACKDDESGNEYDLDECLEYFENMPDMGYYVYYDLDDAIILKR